MVLASDKKKGINLTGCRWASSTRLLCEYFGMWNLRGTALPATRLVAVDIDGSHVEVLVQRELKRKDEFALDQSLIIDLLPDDPEHILLQVREKNGRGVSRVNIDKNRTKTVERPQNSVWRHWSDGHGEVRIRHNENRTGVDYDYRLVGERRWRTLHRFRPGEDHNIYSPAAILPESTA